eukprot:TRINITY_DN7616_c0_g1_i1.p1 TRINITY_DN7616_c0_g1~~TRINITY_DN7616_c0_g1_i1.p1  ORF type:complete len:139 (+),score=10.11 TRINITY_DN7616_c0_g1_i1:123-539(+)
MRFERVQIPARFLLMLAHLIQVLHICIQRRPHVDAALDPDIINPSRTYYDVDTHLQGLLAYSLLALAVTAISYFTGYTMFHQQSSLWSTCIHTAASLALSYYISERRSADLYFYFAIFVDTPLLSINSMFTLSRMLRP